jgi:hypothetical protein
MPSDGVGDHEASEVESGVSRAGFDHGAGHPLLYLDDAKAPNCRKNNEFKDLGNYSEWPKVAGAVINASRAILALANVLTTFYHRIHLT